MDYPSKCKVKCNIFCSLCSQQVFISSYTSHIFEIILCFDFYLFYDHKCASVLLWNANVMGACGLSMYQFNLHENSNLIPPALISSKQHSPLISRMSTHPCLSYQETRLRLHSVFTLNTQFQ